VVAVLLASRFLIGALPLRNVATRLPVLDAIVVSVGLVGLVFHCGAMFFRREVDALPGAHSTIATITALGTASIIWYVVPAALVLIGLRRQHPIALTIVAVAFAAVGYTMYDGGALATHLSAIFFSVVLLATVAAFLIVPPWKPSLADSR
jgi:hypothetical protein